MATWEDELVTAKLYATYARDSRWYGLFGGTSERFDNYMRLAEFYLRCAELKKGSV